MPHDLFTNVGHVREPARCDSFVVKLQVRVREAGFGIVDQTDLFDKHRVAALVKDD